jgi:hypothetical protein
VPRQLHARRLNHAAVRGRRPRLRSRWTHVRSRCGGVAAAHRRAALTPEQEEEEEEEEMVVVVVRGAK